MSTLDLSISEQAKALFRAAFHSGPAPFTLTVPGRVNLIGEHIDYHHLPVLPMAIQKHIAIAFRPRPDSLSRVVSAQCDGVGHVPLTLRQDPGPDGDWLNYLKGATAAVLTRWPIPTGIDAAFASNLPLAAGLSSSSALLVGFALALLLANGTKPSLEELMDVLPQGEQFVGTRGGAMDHAVVLAAHPRCALWVNFAPFCAESVPIPSDWRFLVAHSLTHARKSSALRSKYNALRAAGTEALMVLDLPSFDAALEAPPGPAALKKCSDCQLRAFRHVTSEAIRVRAAKHALQTGDTQSFGRILNESHRSLRDRLGVSTPALNDLVEASLRAGALGARLTGAGFGGCIIVLAEASECTDIQSRLFMDHYSQVENFNPEQHLFIAEPSAGALVCLERQLENDNA